MGELQERITSTNKGSITSVQAIYVPADDLTDPAPATAFAHLDATTVLSRAISELGIYPAVDPLDSTSTMLSAEIVGAEHYQVARAVQKILQKYKELVRHHRHPRAWTSSREDDKLTVSRARKIAALPLAAVLRGRDLHRHAGQVRRGQGHGAQLQGDRRRQVRRHPEQAFYMQGGLDDVRAKAEQLKKESGN